MRNLKDRHVSIKHNTINLSEDLNNYPEIQYTQPNKDIFNGKRIHFASAMTLLRLNNGDNATTGHIYIIIVDFIISGCSDVDANLRELFRIVAFNICIGNSDDRFRNHVFLQTAKRWSFSFAYDMSPTLNDHQSLPINSKTNESNLSILLNSCEEYMLVPEIAKGIIHEIAVVVKEWRTLANKLDIVKREISIFEGIYDRQL